MNKAADAVYLILVIFGITIIYTRKYRNKNTEEPLPILFMMMSFISTFIAYGFVINPLEIFGNNQWLVWFTGVCTVDTFMNIYCYILGLDKLKNK